MTRLGLRLALAGGRGAVAGVGFTVAAVAIGTAILLFAISFLPAVQDRDARTAWRSSWTEAADGQPATLVLPVEDRVGQDLLLRLHVATADAATGPVPPGIPRLPAVGEAYVSPALAERIAAMPSDALGDRIGTVAGTIADASLASPDELVAIIGTDRADLEVAGAVALSAFGTEVPPLELPPIGLLIIVLAAVGALAPVAVFVGTATRMSATRRELRLAALRLVGATPAQVARLAVVEALIATSLGALAGVVLFLALRPLVARIPLDDATWWPGAIVPPLPGALALLLAVQVVGALGALVAMRRLTVTPLGVQRRSQPAPPSAGRAVPLVISLVALLGLIVVAGSGLSEGLVLGAIGLAFAGVIGSIAYAGPWLTAVVGRGLHRTARGAASLLAARRLGDDPRGSFGAIAGVIMAVFVASAFFTFAAYARAEAGRDTDPLLQPGAAVAYLGSHNADDAALAERIADVAGVTRAVAIREVGLVRGTEPIGSAWLASCGEVVDVLGLPKATCPPGGLAGSSGFLEPGELSVVLGAADGSGTPTTAVQVTVPPDLPRLVADEGELAGFLPPLLIDTGLVDPTVLAQVPVTRIYAATDGSAGVGERIRTALAPAAPASFVRLDLDRFAEDSRFEEIGRIVALGLVGTLALAGCSLAIAVSTATMERRRQFVFLRSAGMSARTLAAVILLQAGVPLVAVAGLSAALGAFVGSAVLLLAGGVLVLPDPSSLAVLSASLAVAMLFVVLTLPPLERMTRPASLRHE